MDNIFTDCYVIKSQLMQMMAKSIMKFDAENTSLTSMTAKPYVNFKTISMLKTSRFHFNGLYRSLLLFVPFGLK